MIGTGFKASLQALDVATAHIPTDGPVIIATASYEGEPADNAAQFVGWLQGLSADAQELKGVHYTVFGCGNREWARTYQRVPALVDTLLEAHGAERLLARGEADAGSVGFFQDFEDFEGKMWGVLDEVRLLLLLCCSITDGDFVDVDIWIQRRKWVGFCCCTGRDAQRRDR